MCTSRNSIDRLPDEVLIDILSCLPMKDAVRTSVLSHRWRYFWKFTSVLDFNGLQVRYNSNYLNTTIESQRITFGDWVDRVLESHIGTIEKLRIWFDFDLTSSNYIDRWLKFAFTKRVKRLELQLGMIYCCRWSYVFPNIFDPIERSRIFPIGEKISSCCESLVTLHLNDVAITGKVLELFISNCPLLEELSVAFASSLTSLITSRPLKRLRRLVINQCPFLNVIKISSPNLLSCLEITSCPLLDILEISSPNLLKFSLAGEKVSSIVLKNVPSHIDVYLKAEQPESVIHNLDQISRCLIPLENLKIHITKLKVSHPLPNFPNLSGLKKLVVTVRVNEYGNLLRLAPLIDAAPMLREIKLKLVPQANRSLPIYMGDRYPRKTIKGHRHECLEVLRIKNFTGSITELKFVKYVSRHAVSLKEVVISICSETKTGGREAVHLLKSKLPRRVKLTTV